MDWKDGKTGSGMKLKGRVAGRERARRGRAGERERKRRKSMVLLTNECRHSSGIVTYLSLMCVRVLHSRHARVCVRPISPAGNKLLSSYNS